MPPQEVIRLRSMPRSAALQVFRKARKINVMLQGTMSLEGQDLDKHTLKSMKNQTIRDLLAIR